MSLPMLPTPPSLTALPNLVRRSRFDSLCRFRLALLLLPVAQRRLDRILRQHRTVNFHGRQSQFTDNIRVLDRKSFFYRLALDPLGRERRTRNRRPAAERLELRFFNDARGRVDLHLQLHDVAAFRRADKTGPYVRIGLVQRANVTGIVVMLDYFFTVSH